MTGKLEEWIFDKTLKAVDAYVITTDEGTYVLYMLADGEAQWKSHVREAILQEALDAALENLAKKYEAKYSECAIYDISHVTIK